MDPLALQAADCDFLFARPSFVEGWARLWDFGNTLQEYNRTDDPDGIAIRQDWLRVGDALREALRDAGTLRLGSDRRG